MSRERKERSRASQESRRGSPATRGSSRADGDAPPLGARTAAFGAAGVVVAGIGFYLLAGGSTALAPFLLAVAFLVLFPFALVK